MGRSSPSFVSFSIMALAITVAGCEKAQDRSSRAPAASMPRPSGMTDAQGPTDGHEVALKAAGLNSAEELNRDLAALDDPNLRESFETAYRRTFSAKIAQRDYPQSLELAQKVIGARPQFAPAYRVLGYAYFNAGQASEALRAYLKAVEINPNYGEAHYALAFMYAMGDVGAGREHFKKALDLGVKDERKLGERFYSDTP